MKACKPHRFLKPTRFRKPQSPHKLHHLLHPFRKAKRHRTGPRRFFQNLLLRVSVIILGHYKSEYHFGNTPRVGSHDFSDLDVGAIHVKCVVSCANAHDGEGTSGKGGSTEICGRKSLCLALVVQRCVGDDFRAGEEVRGFSAEFAQVGYGGCHGEYCWFVDLVICGFGYLGGQA